MRFVKSVSAAMLTAGLMAPPLAAQAPTTGWRAESLGQMATIERKFTMLAEAMPWEKYSWRPGQGVRSVCEVFLHITGENYLGAEPLGAKTPAGVNVNTIETCPDGKEKVLATMKAGFAHFRNATLATAEADADVMVEFYGKRTKRALLLSIVEHAGEHLGQSIAYARTNGVVPPWSK